jgi:hypothetical protein
MMCNNQAAHFPDHFLQEYPGVVKCCITAIVNHVVSEERKVVVKSSADTFSKWES